MLFTVIMNYGGGIYIRQVRARTPQKALENWAQTLDHRGIKKFGERSKQSLIAEIAFDKRNGLELAAIDGALGVWCACPLVRGRCAIINIVATSSGLGTRP